MKKITRSKNLFALFFAILLFLPIFSILGRVIYVQSNKNAKDSYSGESTYEINYKYQSNEVNNVNDLVEGNTYLFTFNTLLGGPETINNNFLNDNNVIDINKYSLIYSYSFSYTYKITETNLSNIDYFEFYNEISYVQNVYSYNLVNTDNEQDDIALYIDLNDVGTNLTYNLTTSIVFTIVAINDLDYFTPHISSISEYNEIESVDIDNTGTLDNAFEYSIQRFVENDNIGKLNFFTWFEDMFLEDSNQVNALYIHFANWYMNYALLLSVVYILFLVLMWFINWVRKLLTKGMDFGEGSY